jgi:hypothetical protein
MHIQEYSRYILGIFLIFSILLVAPKKYPLDAPSCLKLQRVLSTPRVWQ